MSVTSVNSAAITRWPETMPTTSNNARPTATFGDLVGAMAANALASVQSVNNTQRQSTLVSSGLQKIQSGLLIMADPSAALETPGARALFERGQQARSDIASAGDRLLDRRNEMIEQTRRKLAEIKKRIEARENASFWDKLVNIFKTIASVCVAVASAVTGNVPGMVGAGFALGSVAAGLAGSEDLALGLGIAGAVFCIGGGVVSAFQEAAGQTVNQLAQRTSQVLTLAAGQSSLAAAVGVGVRAGHQSDELEAQAELAEIKARCKKLMQQVEQDEDLMRELQQTVHRAAMKIVSLLEDNHQAQLAATAG